MPLMVKQKIDAVQAKRPGCVKHYICYSAHDGTTCEKVLCKLCHTAIRSLAPHEKTGHMILVNCPNYTVVTIEFDDGSAHATPLCKQCAINLTQEDIEQIYAQDLLQMHEEERKGMGMVRWNLFHTRKPTGVKREK